MTWPLLIGGGETRARPSVHLGRPVSDRRIFRVEGQPWRYCGVTAFKLLELFGRGQDVTPFLRTYRALGFNTVRVFRDKPAVPGLDEGWSAPPLSVVLDFYRLLALEGFYGELTLCTQPTPDLSFIPSWIEALGDMENVFVEAVNEPQAHDKPATSDLRWLTNVDGRDTLQFASGDYDPPNPFYGSYCTVHADRVPDPWEMARKAKVVRDVFDGWPVDDTNPASVAYGGCHCPVVGDEPGKPSDFQYNLDAITAHFAIYGLLGAGGLFHALTNQFGQLPDERDYQCAEAAAKGLQAFPADTALGAYVRIDEGAGSLRTYRCGPRYGVRVHPTTGSILIGVMDQQ